MPDKVAQGVDTLLDSEGELVVQGAQVASDLARGDKVRGALQADGEGV